VRQAPGRAKLALRLPGKDSRILARFVRFRIVSATAEILLRRRDGDAKASSLRTTWLCSDSRKGSKA